MPQYLVSNYLPDNFDPSSVTEEMMEEIPEEEEEPIEATSYAAEEKEDEKAYAEQLWSQVDSSQSC